MTRVHRARSAPLALAMLAPLVFVACGTSTPSQKTSPAATQSTPTEGPSASAAPGSVGPSPSPAPSVSLSAPPIDPADFVASVDNAWFPLVPGTKLTYKGIKDGEAAVDVFTITAETKVVDGVTCVVIRDELTLAGVLEERTEDWYAQDRTGNVWYFGEATAELDASGAVVSTEGSWQGGVDGALPGIFMPADPQIGLSLAQETYSGQAEDHFVVLLTATPVNVKFGSFKDALLTAEWTPLEPAVLSEKYYAKGIGTLKETDIVGSDEALELVAVSKP